MLWTIVEIILAFNAGALFAFFWVGKERMDDDEAGAQVDRAAPVEELRA